MQLPRIFIGSSSEGRMAAGYVQMALQEAGEPQVWDQGIFPLTATAFAALLKASDEFDFAVLILTPDDVAQIRQVEEVVPRDNVIFELGLFIGAIGPERTFIVTPLKHGPKIPTDIVGVIPGKYDDTRQNLQAALGPVCTQICSHIAALGLRRSSSLVVSLSHDCRVTIAKGNVLDSDVSGNAIVLPANVYFDTTFDQDIVDERSTLGVYLKDRINRGAMADLDDAIDAELSSRSFDIDDGQPRLAGKAGRGEAFQPGSFMIVRSIGVDLVLMALTRMRKTGTRFSVETDELDLTMALNAFWTGVGRSPIRSPLHMPLIGSGFGGIGKRVALAQLLMSLRLAERQARTRLFPEAKIVVYDRDWGNGNWVRAIAEGLLEG